MKLTTERDAPAEPEGRPRSGSAVSSLQTRALKYLAPVGVIVASFLLAPFAVAFWPFPYTFGMAWLVWSLGSRSVPPRRGLRTALIMLIAAPHIAIAVFFLALAEDNAWMLVFHALMPGAVLAVAAVVSLIRLWRTREA